MPLEEQVTPPVAEPVVEQPAVEQQAPVAAPTPEQVDEVEARAREQGWVPKEEWQGDPAAWRPANVFVDRGELLGKIKSQSSKMRELEGMLNFLSEQNRKLYEAGYAKAVDELEAARDAAVEAGDTKAVRELDRKLRDHERALIQARQPAPRTNVSNTADELFQDWAGRNPWYAKDEVMQDWANGAAVKMKTKNPNISDVEIYQALEQGVRKVFPDKFKRVGAPSPDGASNRGAGSPARKDGNSEFDALLNELSEDEAQIARNLVKRGHVTKEKFIQDFKLVSGRR